MINFDEIKSQIDELMYDEPSKTSMDIYSFINGHGPLFYREFGNFVKQFEVFFDDLNTVHKLLNYAPKENWPDTKKIQYLMFPETMKTLHRAFEDLIAGYYDECMMLNRGVYETFLRLVFISCYPNDYESVFIKGEKGKMAFKVTNFVKDSLKLDWEFLYYLMSAIYHSKKHKLLKQMTDIQNGSSEIIQMVYESDHKIGMPMSVNTIMLNLSCLFQATISIFGPDFTSHGKLAAVKTRTLKVNTVLLSMFNANSKPEFAKLNKDIEKIGQIIVFANEGKDWKSLA